MLPRANNNNSSIGSVNYSPEGVRANVANTIVLYMGRKNGLHAFGYNSAESEQIWMKFRTFNCEPNVGGLVLADFGRDPRSSDSFENSRNFVFISSGK